MKNLNQLQKNAIRALVGAGIILIIGGINNPAHAEFDDEVEKVNAVAGTISGIVTGMTDVAILPMGISASMRTFRHIVLQNV